MHKDNSQNPFLKIEDPYEGQKKHLEETQKIQIEFERLCYEVFHINADGKKVLETLKEKFLLPRMIDPAQPNSDRMAFFWEGFKEAIRTIDGSGKNHLARINGAK